MSTFNIIGFGKPENKNISKRIPRKFKNKIKIKNGIIKTKIGKKKYQLKEQMLEKFLDQKKYKTTRPTLKKFQRQQRMKKEKKDPMTEIAMDQIVRKMLSSIVPGFSKLGSIKDTETGAILMKPIDEQHIQITVNKKPYNLRFIKEVTDQDLKDSVIFDIGNKSYGIKQEEISKILFKNLAEQKTLIDQQENILVDLNKQFEQKNVQFNKDTERLRETIDRQEEIHHNLENEINEINEKLQFQENELQSAIQQKQITEQEQQHLLEQIDQQKQKIFKKQKKQQQLKKDVQNYQQDLMKQKENYEQIQNKYQQDIDKQKLQVEEQKNELQNLKKDKDKIFQEAEIQKEKNVKLEQINQDFEQQSDLYMDELINMEKNLLKSSSEQQSFDIAWEQLKKPKFAQDPQLIIDPSKKEQLQSWTPSEIKAMTVTQAQKQLQPGIQTALYKQSLQQETKPTVQDIIEGQEIPFVSKRKKAGASDIKIQQLKQIEDISEEQEKELLKKRVQKKLKIEKEITPEITQEQQLKLTQIAQKKFLESSIVKKKQEEILEEEEEKEIKQKQEGQGQDKKDQTQNQLKLKKINKVQNVKAIINNKYESYKNIKSDIIDFPIYHPYLIVQIAPRGSGKTTTVQYLLENFMQKNKKVKTDCYVYLKSIDDQYIELQKIYEKNNFKFIIINSIEQIQQMMDEFHQENDYQKQNNIDRDEDYINKKNKTFITKRICIFDDISQSLRSSKEFNQLIFNSRHYRILLIINLQSFKAQITPAIRQNVDILHLYRGLQNEVLDQINKEYFSKKYQPIVEKAYEELQKRENKYDFLNINLRDKSIRINFNLQFDLNN